MLNIKPLKKELRCLISSIKLQELFITIFFVLLFEDLISKFEITNSGGGGGGGGGGGYGDDVRGETTP